VHFFIAYILSLQSQTTITKQNIDNPVLTRQVFHRRAA